LLPSAVPPVRFPHFISYYSVTPTPHWHQSNRTSWSYDFHLGL
jgi:hypothetical protein